MNKGFWLAERRLLSDALEAHSWLVIAYEHSREDAEAKYNFARLFLDGHEMRLVAPGGAVVRRDPREPAARVAAAGRKEAA